MLFRCSAKIRRCLALALVRLDDSTTQAMGPVPLSGATPSEMPENRDG